MAVAGHAVSPRQRGLQIVSWIGLGISTVALVAALPNLFTNGGGAGTVLGNTAACLWTLLLLALAVSSVRTIGLQAVAGAWFSGFFGVTSLAALIGRPAVDQFGADSSLAVAMWAPLTEEALKLLPVAVFLILATRNRHSRPSVGDAVLFGATVGGAFAVYENALYGRGVGGAFTHLPFSPLLPSLQKTSDAGGTTMLVGGHLVWTALAALGLGIALTYRRRSRLAWLAAPLTFAVAFIEHAAANGLSLATLAGGHAGWVDPALVLTLDGYLSTLLLLAGVLGLIVVERRLLNRNQLVAGPRPPAGQGSPLRALWPSRGQIAERGAALALAQRADRAPQHPDVRPRQPMPSTAPPQSPGPLGPPSPGMQTGPPMPPERHPPIPAAQPPSPQPAADRETHA